LSASSSEVRLAFTPTRAPLDYGRRIGRLRWRRAMGSTTALAPGGESPASELDGGGILVLVRDDQALPMPENGGPRVAEGSVIRCLPISADRVPAHTLRELEDEGWPQPSSNDSAERAPAIAFRPSELPPIDGETCSEYAARLFAAPSGVPDSGFRAVVFEDPAEYERPELVARFSKRVRRLCDVGCGAGSAGAAWKSWTGGHATGIELDPVAVARARERLDRVIEGDAREVLSDLAKAGETFDAFLFADVLEHLEDSVAALALARLLATPGAELVVSVPNVGHFSIVRDLVFGRFDPLAAGLLDAGHLRWFDRHWLAEALEEAGWSVTSIESLPGAPAPQSDRFLEFLAGWPGLELESLLTYQWLAIARPGSELRPLASDRPSREELRSR
jgi:SAM-dependent methyltransferase